MGDERAFHESDYFLPTSFVNSFARDVRARPTTEAVEEDELDVRVYDPTAEPDPSDATHATKPEEGDPTDGAAVVSSCTKNWKAAAAEDKKRSWGIFDETGIFASACRHGLILWLIDMVRSGEL